MKNKLTLFRPIL